MKRSKVFWLHSKKHEKFRKILGDTAYFLNIKADGREYRVPATFQIAEHARHHSWFLDKNEKEQEDYRKFHEDLVKNCDRSDAFGRYFFFTRAEEDVKRFETIRELVFKLDDDSDYNVSETVRKILLVLDE